MTDIDVTGLQTDLFAVAVHERGTSSHHEVVATADHVAAWAPGKSPADLVEASFKFLLDREPKESIMARFDLPTISRYFPEYPERIGDYL